MRNLKLRLLFSLLAVGLAVSFAFGTQQSEGESPLKEQGYVHGIQPCQKSVFCNTDGLIQCTADGKLVWAMDGSTGCNRPLYFD